MVPLPLLLTKLQKVGSDRLGALEGTSQFLGCFDGPEPLTKVLSGQVQKWQWRSVSEEEITTPAYFAVTLYIKHFAIAVSKTIQALRADSKTVDADASLVAVRIGQTVFLKDSYPTTDIKFNLQTDDANIYHLRGGTIKGVFRGIFDFNTCSYYHTFPPS